MNPSDTIAAISSAVGPAARMIVRASGPLVRQVHRQLTRGDAFDAGSAARLSIYFSDLTVAAWVYRFAAPRSATGEDVVEFHIPGNPLLARMLLDEMVRLGARQAEPGEFTARAYFNGRMDLSEAEGVAATIAAQNQRELGAARQLLAGELARRLRPVLDEITQTLALIEAEIDFSEEGVSFTCAAQLRERITHADDRLEQLLKDSTRFERLSHEPRIVLVGRPNAGKSTLLNALAGHDRAIVSPRAGTTRDAIWSHVQLSRGMVRLIDVAGIEETNQADEIARSMQNRAQQAIDDADLVLLVRDCTDDRAVLQLAREPDLLVVTKIDLDAGKPHRTSPVNFAPSVQVSATSGENLDLLQQRLDQLAFGAASTSGASLALNARHVQCITECRGTLRRALDQLPTAGSELLALDLREALDALGCILGCVTPDEVLGRIFSTFCIGK